MKESIANNGKASFPSEGRFSNPECFPLNELGGLALNVYTTELFPPRPTTNEFTRWEFPEPAKRLYAEILSDIAQGMAFNRGDRAAGYIGPKLMPTVTFTSAGQFAGSSGSKTSDEAVDGRSKLNITQIGCFMPAEHIRPSSPGPRLIILSSPSGTGLIAGTVTFTLDDQTKAISGIDVRDISSEVRKVLSN